uniref:Uncharacterized protein n=2 Tax=Oryza TaxID=4527 RepID=A0A0E0GI62_ORYNI
MNPPNQPPWILSTRISGHPPTLSPASSCPPPRPLTISPASLSRSLSPDPKLQPPPAPATPATKSLFEVEATASKSPITSLLGGCTLDLLRTGCCLLIRGLSTIVRGLDAAKDGHMGSNGHSIYSTRRGFTYLGPLSYTLNYRIRKGSAKGTDSSHLGSQQVDCNGYHNNDGCDIASSNGGSNNIDQQLYRLFECFSLMLLQHMSCKMG